MLRPNSFFKSAIAIVPALALFVCVLPVRAEGPPAAVPSTVSSFDRQLWLKDYSFLKEQLEHSYANLAWFASTQSPMDLRRLDQRTLKALGDAEDSEEAKAAILAFVESFHDGHLSPISVLQPAPSAFPKPPNPDWDKLSPTEGCAAMGFAPARSVAFSLPFESLVGFTFESDGISRVFRAGTVTTSHGLRIGILRIPRFREKDGPPWLCIQEWTARCNAGLPITADSLQEKITDAWLETLAAQLRQFQKSGVGAVLVDVGGNPGGNDTGDWAARLFTPDNVHSARLYMAASVAAGAYFDEQIQGIRETLDRHPEAGSESKDALLSAIAAIERRKTEVAERSCDMSWAWCERRPWNLTGSSRLIEAGLFSGQVDYLPAGAMGNRDLASAIYWAATADPWRGAWSGPVYVLTDGGTGSSAEMFSAIMRDNGIAKIVGTPTGGSGAGFMGDSPPIELPHSRLRFQAPNCVRLRADGTDEVAGIQPDLPVIPRQGEDARLVRQRHAAFPYCPRTHGRAFEGAVLRRDRFSVRT